MEFLIKHFFLQLNFSYLTSQTVMWELYTFLRFIEPSRNSISVYLHFSHISTLMKYTEPWELQAPPATEQVQFRMTRHKKVLFYMWASLFSLIFPILHPFLLRAISSTSIHFLFPPPPALRLSRNHFVCVLQCSRSRSRNPVFSPHSSRCPRKPQQLSKKHQTDCTAYLLEATLRSVSRF